MELMAMLIELLIAHENKVSRDNISYMASVT